MYVRRNKGIKPRGTDRIKHLQNGFDFGVQRDVGHGLGVNGEFHAIEIVEMEKAADVVVLVITGKKLLGFGAAAADAAPLLEAARKRHLPLTFTAIAEPHIAALYERKFVLVRPDGHVAWRGDHMPEDALCVIDVVRGAADPCRMG